MPFRLNKDLELQRKGFCTIVMLVAGTLLCGGCGQSSQEIVTEEIHAQKFEQTELPFNSFGSIFLNETDETLYKSEVLGNIVVKRLDLHTGACTDLIRKGRGPNEYTGLMITKIDPSTGIFHACDLAKSELCTFTPDGAQITATPIGARFFQAIPLGKYIVSYGNELADDGNMFELSDSTGKTVVRFGPFPDDGMPYSHQAKTMAYQGKLIFSAQRSRFAFLMDFGNVFDIYEIGEDGVPASVFSIHEETPVYEPSNATNGVRFVQIKVHYTDAYASQRYIYALYSGKIIEDDAPDADRLAMETSTIRVYDWDGNRICDLLADIPLLSICVSADDSYLIGLYSEDYVLKCCRFDLPKRLRE